MTARKHNFMTLFSDLVETESLFMEKILSCFLSAALSTHKALLVAKVTANKQNDSQQLNEHHQET